MEFPLDASVAGASVTQMAPPPAAIDVMQLPPYNGAWVTGTSPT
jgi:hypothetical protein